MFTAVTAFVKESFAEEGELGSLEYGENEILLERGKNIYLAVVVAGKSNPRYRESMREVVRNVEANYGSVIEGWSGAISAFGGVKKMLLPLFDVASEKRKVEKGAVQLLAATEFFQGYIRLKAAVKNDTRSVITGVEFEPLYEEESFRLVKTEPEYPIKKGRIDFGVINPGVKKTVAFYLEPMICTESFMEGTLKYKDAEGDLHTEVMKKKRIEVVCPIFYTDENINVAMLKRLVSEELTQQDSRIWTITEVERAFIVAKEVVLGRQVRLVRELADDAGVRREAWFYGTTQDKKYKIIFRVSENMPEKMLEVFVATPGKLLLTGCLAEIGRDIADRLTKEGKAPVQVSDMEKKERIIRETLSLIEKFSEAEADAEDD